MPNNKPFTIAGAVNALAALGYPRPFVKKILPAWWDQSAAGTSAGALEYALMLRDRLGLRSSFNPEGALQIESDVPGARFKKRTTTDLPALATSTRLGSAVSRMALRAAPPPIPLPTDPDAIHRAVAALAGGAAVTLEWLTRYCWRCGIPVVYLQMLPGKAAKMAGMVIRHHGRFAIVLAHAYRENARQAFIVAHELGHIVLGHLAEDGVFVDEAVETVEETLRWQDTDTEEQAADAFALRVLRGNMNVSEVASLGVTPATLAARASVATRDSTVDPAHLVLSYAYTSRDWKTATQAMRFLPGSVDAPSVLHRVFREEGMADAFSQDDRDYLAQMQGTEPATP